MISPCHRRLSRINWSAVRTLLLLALVLLLLGGHSTLASLPAGLARSTGARAQAVLYEAAAEQPDSTVGVIVQMNGPASRLPEMVSRLGGIVTDDLWLIHAFAAELPAKAVPQLAQADGVRWISLDAPVVESTLPCIDCVSTASLKNAYVRAVGADRLWNQPPYLQGQGITVAVVDSGMAYHDDLTPRIVKAIKFNSDTNNHSDQYGHGTHIAGIIGGSGALSKGAYIGVAPKVKLVNVKVCDNQGASRTSDVVAGLQWVYQNRDKYNIRVVNLSLNSSVPESYDVSPLDAALEILWFNRIVVVVSAGNSGVNGILYPPANDPFIITVGATDDKGTGDTRDDVLASYSARGITQDGFAKPDIVAPGTNIISLLSAPSSVLYKQHPANRVDTFGGRDHYFRMSGTSMASAVASGAAAILLQSNPSLNPDQVKYRLMATGRPFEEGASYLDLYAAVRAGTTQTANTGTRVSNLLFTGPDPANWGSVDWGSVDWGSVDWGSVDWGSVDWGSVDWGSDYWGN